MTGLACALSLSASELCSQPAATVQIVSGEFGRQNTPILLSVPEQFRVAERLELNRESTSIELQWFDRERSLAAAILRKEIPATEKQSWQLRVAQKTDARASHSSGVSVRAAEDGSYLSLSVGAKEVLRYPLVLKQPPAGIEPIFAHSGHIHPLLTPAGKTLTAEFPADHPHQHGIFNAWVNTTFEGRKVDFWNQKDRTGMVEHVRVVDTASGSVFGQFTVELAHLDLSGPTGKKPVLREFWTVRAWNIDSEFLLDIESRQTCIADSPLTINEYHYGGMSFRGREDWLGKTRANFHTSEGKSRSDGNHTRPTWTAIAGQVDGSACCLTVMGHPENFRHPEPVRLHPEKPYFVFTPPQLGSFERPPGKEVLARYRYHVTDTAYSAPRAEQVWNDYAAPPIRVATAN